MKMYNKQKTIIYLHGFLSSPQSLKAQQSIDYFAKLYPDIEVVAPQLANEPASVSRQLQQLLAQYSDTLIGFIGSSLGGYFATYCAQQSARPAVLINPAVYPYRLLSDYLGSHQHPYTGEQFVVSDEFNQALKSFEVENVTNLSIKAYVQTADETLDYRQACEKFESQQVTVIEGGDHAFQGYQNYLPEIAEFLLSNYKKVTP